LNYLERRNGVILRYFSEFGYLPGVLRKSSRSLSHLLMSSCFNMEPRLNTFTIVYKLRHISTTAQIAYTAYVSREYAVKLAARELSLAISVQAPSYSLSAVVHVYWIPPTFAPVPVFVASTHLCCTPDHVQ